MKLYNSDYINRLMLEFSSMCIYALLFGGIIYIGDFGLTSEKIFSISLLLGFFAGLLDDIGRKIEEFNLDILEQIKKAERVETVMEDLEKKIKAFSEMHKGKSADDILAEMRGEEPRQEDKPTTIKGTNGNNEEIPNSAWSEEDKEMVQVAINACCSYQDSLVRNDSRFDKAVKAEDWLKSLKARCTWKPSDYQLEALDSATENCAYSEYQDCLRELLKQLKKLKG